MNDIEPERPKETGVDVKSFVAWIDERQQQP